MTERPTEHTDLLRKLALGLPGTTETPHFDRRAFRARRIYATVMATADIANLCLTPDGQAHWSALLPEALSPVPNRWGARGWTEVRLDRIDPADLAVVLRLAWGTGGGRDPNNLNSRRSASQGKRP